MLAKRADSKLGESKKHTDFRLLIYAIGIWCGALLANQFSWRVVFLPLLPILFLLYIKSRYLMLAIAVLVGSTVFSLHIATLQRSELATLGTQRAEVDLRATVTSDVKKTSHKVSGSILRKPQYSFLARVTYLSHKDFEYQMRLPIRILASQANDLVIGQEIELTCQLLITKEKRVAATCITNELITILSPASKLSNFLSEIRSKYRSEVSEMGSTAATLIPGMILGDTSLQSEEFSTQMRRSGLSHLTAVSGANFAIVSALVLWLMRFVSRRIAIQVGATAIFLVLFLLLVRPSPSVLRAGVMAAVILLARATGNLRNAASALAAAIATLLLLDPFQAQDPGFVLSVLATAGLIFIAPEIAWRLSNHLPDPLAEVISVSTAATILCTPYILFLSGEISSFSVIFNILVSPFVAPITILGFVAVLVLPLPFLADVLLLCAEFLARWIVLISSWSMATPSWQLNPLFLILLICILIFLRQKLKYGLLIGVACLLVINLTPRLGFPGSDWRIAQCDVGQGDALVLNLGGSAAVLFDVGPNPVLINRCLKVLGVKELSLIVLSHNHADHTFGLMGAAKNRKIGKIWSNQNVMLAPEFSDRNEVMSQGDAAQIGPYLLEVLWPAVNNSSNQLFDELPGDGSRENNLSLVVKVSDSSHVTKSKIVNGIESKPVSILVTGDLEPEAQQQLLRESSVESIGILKVPHHGSRFQDDNFLARLSPEIALISVGKGNSYGHPDPGLLRKLQDLGAQVYRTDIDGPISVAWRFDDAQNRYIFTTRAMRKEWWRIQWL